MIFSTVALPLGAYVFAWPLLFALAGFALAFASGEGSFVSAKSLGLIALCAAPGVALVAPLVYMFFLMLGLDLGGGFMLLVALVAGLLIPHLRALTWRRRWLLPAVAATLGVCFVIAGLARAGFDARRRKTDSVFYFLDADAGRARWVSTDAASDEWTSQLIKPDATQKGSLTDVFPWVRQPTREAEAPAFALPAPDVRVIEDRTDGDVRRLRVRIASARSAPMLFFYTGPESDVRRATLDGKTILDEESKATDGARSNLRVSFAAPPLEGMELFLETRADAPLNLVVEDLSFGLPEAARQTIRPRSDDTMPAPSYRTSDTTIVRKSLALTPQKP